MATEKPVLTDTCVAENDLRANIYRFVELSGDKQVDRPDNAGDLVYGVQTNKADAGEAVAVMVYGIAKVVAGGAINAGDRVGTDNQGRAVAKAADADKVAGIARTTVQNAGEYVEILLTPGAQRAA